MATTSAVRLTNVLVVLDTIVGQGPLSRADIARMTKLSKTSVSTIITEINQISAVPLVVEYDADRANVGRPPKLLDINRSTVGVLGMSVFTDRIECAWMNLAGETFDRYTARSMILTGDSLLSFVLATLEHCLSRNHALILAVGIACPGIVDISLGLVRIALEVNWRNVHLGELAEVKAQVPVTVMNRSLAAAYAESQFAACADMVHIGIGSDVGAGIVQDGRIFSGHNHQAGELGHIPVVDDGFVCRCGQRGCLEAETRCESVARRLSQTGVDAIGNCGYAALAAGIAEGSRGALEVQKILIERFARAVTVVTRLLDPQVVSLSGELELLGPEFVRGIQMRLDEASLPDERLPELKLVTNASVLPTNGVALYTLRQVVPGIITRAVTERGLDVPPR